MSKGLSPPPRYGPEDPVSLADIRGAGAVSVSTALFHLPAGAVWPLQEILQRKAEVEAAGLRWVVAESIPVHESIKLGRPVEECSRHTGTYKESVANLGRAGIPVLSYSFMPLFDWLRTELARPRPDGSTALAFSVDQFAAWDLHTLQRSGAERDYSAQQAGQADGWRVVMSW